MLASSADGAFIPLFYGALDQASLADANAAPSWKIDRIGNSQRGVDGVVRQYGFLLFGARQSPGARGSQSPVFQ
jgi:hypothetical protein